MFKNLIVLCLLVLVPYLAQAQGDLLKSTHNYTIASGLAHNGVTAIHEDSEGYLWIGTYDGLARYDGYEFTILKNTPGRKLFLSNRIRAIEEDSKGNLWLGTDDGISTYNYTYKKFCNIYSNKDHSSRTKGPVVRKILMTEENVFCITENSGILIFDHSFNYIDKCIPPENFADRKMSLFNGYMLDGTNFILSSSLGIIHFNVLERSFNWVYESAIFNESSVCSYYGNTLLATLNYGIAVFSYSLDNERYKFCYKGTRLESHQFSRLKVDHLNNLWAGKLNNGLLKIEDVQRFVEGKPCKSMSFGNDDLFRTSSIISSKNYGCWVATFNKGIFRFNLNENPFRTYDPEDGQVAGIQANRVEQFCPIGAGKTLVKAQRANLAMFNTKTGKFEPLPQYLSGLRLNGMSTFYVDTKGNTWITHCNGYELIRIRKDKKTLEIILSDDNILDGYGVPTSITEDVEGNIWLKDTDDVFWIKLGENSEVIKTESLNNHPALKNHHFKMIRNLYADPIKKYIWIGTDIDGLFRINFNEKENLSDLIITQFLHEPGNPRSIPSDFVSSIIRLSNNQLWIGTERGGICRVQNCEAEPEFISYNEEHGLSNNVVKSIITDKNENLWICTNIGLNRLDVDNMQFRSYRLEDGLLFEDFFYISERLPDGTLLFSGMTGFIYVKPNEILEEESLPKLRFDNFKLFNKAVYPGDTINKRILLKESISDTKEIVLNHKENVFSIELHSLHYSNPENHYLKYQLLPINKEWVTVKSSQRIINYNGLQPGEYELRVKASNALNQWTDPKNLKIIIKPAFWVTKQAFVLYFIFIVLVIYSIMYYLLRLNKLKHKLEIEHLEKEKVQEVNAAKLRYFSNISHEIKTPLALITGPLSLMAERYKGNSDLINKLSIIQRQSKNISRLVDQVHDFQKADANKLKMEYQNFNFDDFLEELVQDFRFLALNEKKDLEIVPWNERVYISADKDKLEKIINNILNNAFKYTKQKDRITISYSVEKNDLVVSVKDTGKGITADDLPHIFERFYQSKHKHSAYIGGSGIGLAFTKRLVEMHYGNISAESSINNGTTLFVRMPVVAEAPSANLIEKENQILTVESQYDNRINRGKPVNISEIEFDESLRGAKVFIAEDNVDMREFVSGLLANFFEIRSFVNGKDLVGALEQDWPDVIVSDVLMPELNGFELCKTVKSNIKTSHIPIILLTACTAIEEQLKGIKAGADSYIKKPFNIQHLVTRIEALLINRKKLRERYKIDLPVKLDEKDLNEKDIAFLEKLYDLMDENLDNAEFDIDALAQMLFLNRTMFFQKVKVLTNNTPYELLKAYRLKRAGELLIQKQLSVKEVYLLTGFKSRSHFSKVFKEKYGITPGNYASKFIQNTIN